jgi:hypothetical protein
MTGRQRRCEEKAKKRDAIKKSNGMKRKCDFMAFHEKIDFFELLALCLLFLVRPHRLERSALISQKFLCDGEVENDSENVAKYAGNEIAHSGYKKI